ncbi:hypothetical protein ILUMI_17364 [Ignelater luminosus]|uniref:Uncharacterized protein n=1 Tax=Ignelater luminosus TaxID=2038154 RepID=A0A8K0G7C5_IGNLU|nr:hypothetical protein ILUMI_17364 [Ignelater luminosus]
MAIIGENGKQLQHNVNICDEDLKKLKIRTNIQNTSTIIKTIQINHCIKIEGQEIEQVNKFTYLEGATNSKEGLDDEVTKELNTRKVRAEVVRMVIKQIKQRREQWTTMDGTYTRNRQRLVEKVYEVRETGVESKKRPRKTWKEEVKKAAGIEERN